MIRAPGSSNDLSDFRANQASGQVGRGYVLTLIINELHLFNWLSHSGQGATEERVQCCNE